MSTQWPAVEGLAFGGDYTPEQWSPETWRADIELMHQAGVTMVTVGVFTWALLEPREGQLDFTFLDEIIGRLGEAGIAVDLATPTAVPPAWFYANHPEARVRTRDGVALGPGSRGAAAPSHPAYREAITRIATALASRYGQDPRVVMWHVHNEYGVPVCLDYSESAVTAFRTWLQARYGTLGALNEAWGTAFWGQHYGEWSHVGAPGPTASVPNPAQVMDFQRFSDDQLLECFRLERDAIHSHASQPVTTNFMANQSWGTDLWKWASEVDVVSDDHYLWAADDHPEVGLAIAADLTRSLASGRPWVLMEHSTSAVNWQPRNYAKRPGEMARNSLAHVARGADAVMFFQWRASRVGAEKFHSAMVPHAGTDTRVWREVVELGDTLRRLYDVRGSTVQARVAIMWDFDSLWAQGLDWRPSVDVDPLERIRAYYEELWARGIATDFVHPGADLSPYLLVMLPAQYMLAAEEADSLNQYVESGGTLLVSFFSGVVDRNDAVHHGGFLAPLEPALGVKVAEYLPMRPGETVEVCVTDVWERIAGPASVDVNGDSGTLCAADLWQEELLVTDAQVLARHASGQGAGHPAITRCQRGGGAGWYVASRLDTAGTSAVVALALADAGLPQGERLPGVERITRHGDDMSWTFVLNHTTDVACVDVGSGDGLADVMTGKRVTTPLCVPAGGVRIIRSPGGGRHVYRSKPQQ